MSLERIRNTEREDAGWNGGVEVSRELVVEIETGGWEGRIFRGILINAVDLCFSFRRGGGVRERFVRRAVDETKEGTKERRGRIEGGRGGGGGNARNLGCSLRGLVGEGRGGRGGKEKIGRAFLLPGTRPFFRVHTTSPSGGKCSRAVHVGRPFRGSEEEGGTKLRVRRTTSFQARRWVARSRSTVQEEESGLDRSSFSGREGRSAGR